MTLSARGGKGREARCIFNTEEARARVDIRFCRQHRGAVTGLWLVLHGPSSWQPRLFLSPACSVPVCMTSCLCWVGTSSGILLGVDSPRVVWLNVPALLPTYGAIAVPAQERRGPCREPLPVVRDCCSSFLSTAGIRCSDQKQSGNKGFISSYTRRSQYVFEQVRAGT